MNLMSTSVCYNSEMEAVYAVITTFIVGQIADLVRDTRLRRHTNRTLIETAPQRAIEAVSLVLTEQRKASEFAQNLLKDQITTLQEQVRIQQEHIQKQDGEITQLRERVAKLEPSGS